MIIIGFSAKKQGGKSTLVDYFKEKLPCCEVIRFADALKQIILDCFVPREMRELKIPDDLDLDSAKNISLPCHKTIRELLQTIGTDLFRGIWKDCWINAYKKRLSRSKAAFILTPDVRFPNELKVIQEMGGKVIRLLRAPFAEDQHESETALDYVQRNTITAMLNLGFSITCDLGMDTAFLIKDVEISPGKYFDVVYDNSKKTLEDAKIWADQFINKCFSWNIEMDGISNPAFDLSRFFDVEEK